MKERHRIKRLLGQSLDVRSPRGRDIAVTQNTLNRQITNSESIQVSCKSSAESTPSTPLRPRTIPPVFVVGGNVVLRSRLSAILATVQHLQNLVVQQIVEGRRRPVYGPEDWTVCRILAT